MAMWRDIRFRLDRVEQPLTRCRIVNMEIVILALTRRNLGLRGKFAQ